MGMADGKNKKHTSLVSKIKELGYMPDVRIYRKNALPGRHILRDLQRWCNNRIIFARCPRFEDYGIIPTKQDERQLELEF